MAQKQYVNLDENPSKPEESPYVPLTADVTEKNPGDSAGQNGYFFADPDAQGNLPLKHFPNDMRPIGFEKDNKYSISAPIEDKKMKKAARIGSGGGDKFKFKYGKKED